MGGVPKKGHSIGRVTKVVEDLVKEASGVESQKRIRFRVWDDPDPRRRDAERPTKKRDLFERMAGGEGPSIGSRKYYACRRKGERQR